MKKFYIIDPKGNYVSEDGTTHFTLLCGEELYAYLQTPEGKNKHFDTDVYENGDEIGIEIPQCFVKKHLVEKRHKQYCNDNEKEFVSVFLSIDTEMTGRDGEPMTLGDTIPDESMDVVADYQRKEDIASLRMALASLSADDYQLIYDLILSDNHVSEREYGRTHNIPQKTLNCRKQVILEKMRKFF